MIRILKPSAVVKSGADTAEVYCEILMDSAEDLALLTEVVTDGYKVVKPLPGSYAATADGTGCYVLSPSGVWTVFAGGVRFECC